MDVYSMSAAELALYFDHTNLKAFADDAAFRKLCGEAKEYGFKMVAINSTQTALCKELLKGTPVHVGAAISFPLGQTTIPVKVFETKDALQNGADEIDYVVNLSQLKNGNWAYVQEEMESIVAACREAGATSKVIFENCYLEKGEIEQLARVALQVRPDFIKTSTGFGTGGATVDDVKRMKQVVGDAVKVKAAGGIRTLAACREMILAGAERIGTSAGVAIIKELLAEQA